VRFAAAFLLGTLWASVALAQPSYAKAKMLYERGETDKVVPLLQDALEEAITRSEEAQIYALLGRAYALEGRKQRAVRAFTEALERNPSFMIGDEAPKIVAAFQAAVDRRNGVAAAPETSAATADPDAPEPGPRVRESSGDSEAFYQQTWFWVVTTGVLAVVAGGIVAWDATHDEQPDHDFGPYELRPR
jgi:tetratricopeptide (TPR) repeat protein